MTRFVSFSFVASILLTSLTARPAVAETDLSRFPLAKAIPPDVFIAVVERQNPERAFLNEYWAEVSKAFMESGVLTDVWDLISENVPDEGLDLFEENAERLCELSEKMDWGALFGKEFVHAGRLKLTSPSPYSGVLMGRSGKEQAKANYAVLKSLLDEVATETLKSIAGEGTATTTESKDDGASITSLRFRDWPGASINVALWNDVILIGFWDDTMLKESLALLKGSAKQKGLTETRRFKQAFSQLPPAEDTMFYFDVERLLSMVRTVFSMYERPAAAQNPVQPVAAEQPSVPKAIATLVKDLSIVDYVASVEWTEDHRVFSDTVTTLRDGAKSSPIYKILASGAPSKDFEKFIPEEAENFGVSSGINLAELYDYVENFVQKNLPDGKNYVGHFKAMQKELELNIKEDVLSLFGGSTVFATMEGDWTLMAKVTDQQKVEQQLDRLLTFVNGMLGNENALIIEPVDVGAKSKFKKISHPMVMPMMMMQGMTPPVLGCAEGYLIIGSSPNAVKMCLKTAGGDHPNIKQSSRWKKEALSPDGAVTSISFTDESKFAQELEESLNGISMGLGMFAMFQGQMQDAPPAMEMVMTGLPPILAKLGPVAGKIDFYQSSASYETFDGDKWYAREVQNYKKKTKTKTKAKASGVRSK